MEVESTSSSSGQADDDTSDTDRSQDDAASGIGCDGTDTSSASSGRAEGANAWRRRVGVRTWAKRMLPHGLSETMRVVLPCAGWDAPGQALRALQIPCNVVGVWEVCPVASRVLAKMYGGHDQSILHLGPIGRRLQGGGGRSSRCRVSDQWPTVPPVQPGWEGQSF